MTSRVSEGTNNLIVDGAAPMLFASDVAYTVDALEKGIQAGFHNDPVAGVRSIAELADAEAVAALVDKTLGVTPRRS